MSVTYSYRRGRENDVVVRCDGPASDREFAYAPQVMCGNAIASGSGEEPVREAAARITLKAAGAGRVRGKTFYHFCSYDCLRRFKRLRRRP